MQRGNALQRILIVFALLAGSVGLTACTVPRGAALSSEILREQSTETPTYAVVPVGRDNVARLAGWPVTGGGISQGWPAASRGPDSTVIRAGDRISLVIWDSQENSLLANVAQKAVDMPDLTVSSAGTIFVPYLDEVLVRGQTPDQARRQIQQALTPIVPSAQVQLMLEPGQNNSVDLVNGVVKPGSYPLPGRNFTILGLLAQGGGIDKSLRNPSVRLMRDGKAYEIRASTLLEQPSRNVVLRGGDQVLVKEDDRYFTALGATGTQSLIYFEKDEITGLETLALIGGLEGSRANPKGVLILRDYPASALRQDGSGPQMQQVVFTFDLTTADGLFAARNFHVNPKDTVLVTEASLVSTRTVLSLIGSVLGVTNSVSSN